MHDDFEVAGKTQFLTCSHRRRQRRRVESSGSPSRPSRASRRWAGGLLPGPAQAPQCHKASHRPDRRSQGLPPEPFRGATHRPRHVRQGNPPGRNVPSLPRVFGSRFSQLAPKSGSGGCPPSKGIQQLPPQTRLSLSDPSRWREDVQFALRARGINEERRSPWRITAGAGAARGSAVALLSSPAC